MNTSVRDPSTPNDRKTLLVGVLNTSNGGLRPSLELDVFTAFPALVELKTTLLMQ